MISLPRLMQISSTQLVSQESSLGLFRASRSLSSCLEGSLDPVAARTNHDNLLETTSLSNNFKTNGHRPNRLIIKVFGQEPEEVIPPCIGTGTT